MKQKKIGNANRTKNQIRSSKSKGSSMEYDCHESLLAKYPDIYLTKQKGFQMMYDIQTDNGKAVFECKKMKGISWNQAVKFLEKLESLTPKGYAAYLLFQSNRQPCLCMCRQPDGYIQVVRFEVEFSVPFIKHTPIKRKVKGDDKK